MGLLEACARDADELCLLGELLDVVAAAVAHTGSYAAHQLIDQGSSELNVIIGVSEEDLPEAIRRIYDMFINSEK